MRPGAHGLPCKGRATGTFAVRVPGRVHSPGSRRDFRARVPSPRSRRLPQFGRPSNVRGQGVRCERGDSNPHGSPHQDLNLARLPIPPLSRSPIVIDRTGRCQRLCSGRGPGRSRGGLLDPARARSAPALGTHLQRHLKRRGGGVRSGRRRIGFREGSGLSVDGGSAEAAPQAGSAGVDPATLP